MKNISDITYPALGYIESYFNQPTIATEADKVVTLKSLSTFADKIKEKYVTKEELDIAVRNAIFEHLCRKNQKMPLSSDYGSIAASRPANKSNKYYKEIFGEECEW